MKTQLDKLITRLGAAKGIVENEFMSMIDMDIHGGDPFATIAQWQEVRDAIKDALERLEALRGELIVGQFDEEVKE